MSDKFLEIKSDAEKLKIALATLLEEAGSYKASKEELTSASKEILNNINALEDLIKDAKSIFTQLEKIEATKLSDIEVKLSELAVSVQVFDATMKKSLTETVISLNNITTTVSEKIDGFTTILIQQSTTTQESLKVFDETMKKSLDENKQAILTETEMSLNNISATVSEKIDGFSTMLIQQSTTTQESLKVININFATLKASCNKVFLALLVLSVLAAANFLILLLR